MRRKKALIFVWNSWGFNNYIAAFKRMGFECEYLDSRGVLSSDDRVYRYVDEHLKKNRYEIVFSTNYFDHVSNACHKHGIPYIAWCYDSPFEVFDINTLRHDTTHVFCFDSYEAYRYSSQYDLNRIHYLPLAVDTEKYDRIVCTDSDRKRFTAQVSFIGQLYNNNLYTYLNYLDDYHKSFFNSIIDYSVGKYDTWIVEEVFANDISDWLLNDELVDVIYETEGKGRPELALGSKDSRVILGRLSRLVNSTITNRERILLSGILSNHFDYKLFSNEKSEIIGSDITCGTVDYEKEMPKVFKLSDINLNITFKNIKRGIPLRCLDIMGCNAFLLTNHQSDMDEHFKDGYNIALFSSLEEAYDKCEYYLNHDDERKIIAQRGYETVKEYYNFKKLLTRALTLAGLKKLTY